MANIPVNPYATLVSGSGVSITGSFAGFTTAAATTFTALKDYGGGNLASSNGLTIAAGTTVPLLITSASISAGAVLFYP